MAESGLVGRSTRSAASASEAEGARSEQAPGRQSLVAAQPAAEVRAAHESVAGANTEGAQAVADAGGGGGVETIQVQTTLPGAGGGGAAAGPAGGQAAQPAGQADASHASEEGAAVTTTAHNIVAPGGSPTEAGGANTCTPDPASSVLAWDVVDAGTNWRVNVTGLTLTGRVQLNPWPSAPTSMTTPNTANPVDGGNINNTTGSRNHWQFAIDDMAD